MMDKIRKWLHKPKKDAENVIRPSTPAKTCQVCDNVIVTLETLSPTPQRLDALLFFLRELLQTPPSQEAHLHPAPCDILSVRPAGCGASNTETSSCSPRLPVRPFVKTRDDSSLLSSPSAGGRGRHLPCSLPCSPLLGGRSWKSPPFSPPTSALSRLWVEAALQRSKTNRTPPPCSRGEGDGEGEGETGEDGDSELLYSDSWSCCQLTPCRCSRCPSAPPYEEDVQTVSSFNKHHKGQTVLSQRTDVQKTDVQTTDTQRTDAQETKGDSEQSLPRVRALQLGESSRLYPCLSQWRITAGTRAELSRKQKHDFHTCFHGNKNDDHLQQLCVMISGVSGELQTDCVAYLSFILKKVFESTSCSKRTSRPVESCSFCSEEFSIQIVKHCCRNCEQVFCCRCVSRFVSLLQIHEFIQPTGL